MVSGVLTGRGGGWTRAAGARCVLMGALLAAAPCGARAADSVDHGAVPSGNVAVAARFSDMQPSGIVVLPDGSVILGFPRSAQDHAGPRLARLTTSPDGPPGLVAYPDAATQGRLVSPLGMTLDTRGRIWIVDEGTVAGATGPATPALVMVDPAPGGEGVRVLPLRAPAIRPDSHVNDLRIDLTHGDAGLAFITDTSLADHPAIIVVDLASEKAWRVLDGDASTRPTPGFAMEVDGQMHRFDLAHPAMGQGGADGIAISPDSATLYWQPLSGRRLYSAPTAVLGDPQATPAALARAVRDEGETGVVDGMATAPDGSLYLTDLERHAILRRATDGTLSVVAHDPRLISPDGLALRGDTLWLTVGQWSRLPVFHGGHDRQERPWLVTRIRMSGTP
ncbi:gluconolactonase [Gluconacetobacter azotocaptans]|nr:gluconolactonase [Gluconacetobacter azotocaptans]